MQPVTMKSSCFFCMVVLSAGGRRNLRCYPISRVDVVQLDPVGLQEVSALDVPRVQPDRAAAHRGGDSSVRSPRRAHLVPCCTHGLQGEHRVRCSQDRQSAPRIFPGGAVLEDGDPQLGALDRCPQDPRGGLTPPGAQPGAGLVFVGDFHTRQPWRQGAGGGQAR